MKTKEEILGPLRGKGNFIHCVDYEDALNAMEEYVESKLTDLLAVKQEGMDELAKLSVYNKPENKWEGTKFCPTTVAYVKLEDVKNLLSRFPVSEAGEQEKVFKHLYESGFKDGRQQVSRGWQYHYDTLIHPEKREEERQAIIELNKRNPAPIEKQKD